MIDFQTWWNVQLTDFIVGIPFLIAGITYFIWTQRRRKKYDQT